MTKIKQNSPVLFFYNNSKKWLINIAKRVESQANIYNNQLRDCEKKLNKKGMFGLF